VGVSELSESATPTRAPSGAGNARASSADTRAAADDDPGGAATCDSAPRARAGTRFTGVGGARGRAAGSARRTAAADASARLAISATLPGEPASPALLVTYAVSDEARALADAERRASRDATLASARATVDRASGRGRRDVRSDERASVCSYASTLASADDETLMVR
jgi:hypothetical protein